MRRKVLTSLFVIALAAAVIGGATMAWFWDTAETGENTFQAGTLMIALNGVFWDEDEFKFDNLNPGDKFCGEICIKNEGTKNVKFRGFAQIIEEYAGRDNEALDDDESDNPQKMRDALIAREDYGTKKLSEGEHGLQYILYVPLTEEKEYAGLGVYCGDDWDDHVFSEDVADMFEDYGEEICGSGNYGYIINSGAVEDGADFGEHWKPNNPLAPGEAIRYGICFYLPEEAGNEYQGASITGKFGFEAGQWLEDAPFGE